MKVKILKTHFFWSERKIFSVGTVTIGNSKVQLEICCNRATDRVQKILFFGAWNFTLHIINFTLQ